MVGVLLGIIKINENHFCFFYIGKTILGATIEKHSASLGKTEIFILNFYCDASFKTVIKSAIVRNFISMWKDRGNVSISYKRGYVL